MEKTVFFDLGNVIIFFSHEKMCKQLSEVSSVSFEKIQHLLTRSTIADEYERGLLDSITLHKHFCKEFSQNIDIDTFLHSISDIFTLNTSICPLIEQLKNKNTQLILLSNTCPAHFAYAKKNFPILSVFDEYVLSYEVGARKPEKQIFEHALKKTSSEIKNCFYTDDIEEYVQSARTLGLNSHTFTDTENLYKQLLDKGFL